MWSGRSLLNLWSVEGTRKLSCGSGVLLGSVLLVNNQNPEEKKKAWTVEYPAEVKANDVLLSRKIVSDLDKTGLDLRLYQYQTCPYCCKVRAFLDYYGFSYEVVEVNPVTRSQLSFSPGYKKVPVMRASCCEKPLVESSLIISMLATFLHRKSATLDEVVPLYPRHIDFDPKKPKEQVHSFPNKFFVLLDETDLTVPNKQQNLQNIREEREWREWVDEHFIHLISPNVYRTWKESLETFRYFDKVGEWERNFPAWERFLAVYVGAAAMFQISKTLKKRHNIDDARTAMRDALNNFLIAKGPHRRFLGGDEPNLADLALYGAITSFAGCSAFAEMRADTDISEWFESVKLAIQERRGSALLKAKSDALAKAQKN